MQFQVKEEWNARLLNDWERWIPNNLPEKVDALSDDEMRDLLENELAMLREMSIKETILYQKWCEIKRKYPSRETKTLFGTETALVEGSQQNNIDKVKPLVWIPESVDDYLKLEPELVLTSNQWLTDHYTVIRTFCHRQRNNNNIGRNCLLYTSDAADE